jgi:hypothetical protein
MTLAMGCAPAYHSYSGCYVNCHYCPPPPVAYTCYEASVCHSCVAQPYLHVDSGAAEQVHTRNWQERVE